MHLDLSFLIFTFMLDCYIYMYMYWEKEEDLTQSYDKTPYTNRKFENQRTKHKRHQNFDYKTIADRLTCRTVRWSNKSSNWCC